MSWPALVLLFAQPAFASPGEAFAKAEALYQEERYTEAIETYEKIRELGVEDGALYYNLGNAYFKAGRLGLAILNYERASKLMPGDEDTQKNLAFANELVSEEGETPPLPLFVGWAVDLYQRLRPGVLAAVVSSCFLLGGVAASLVLYDRWPRLRNPAAVALIASVIFALLSGVSLLAKLRAEADRTEAVVVTENAYVRSGPGEASPRLAEIHEGLKVRVLSERESWLQVSLSSGLTAGSPRSSSHRFERRDKGATTTRPNVPEPAWPHTRRLGVDPDSGPDPDAKFDLFIYTDLGLFA